MHSYFPFYYTNVHIKEKNQGEPAVSFRGLNFKKVWLYKLCNIILSQMI